MTFEEEFTGWLNSIQPDLRNIFGILKKRLSREPEELIKDLMEAEAYNARCNYLLAQANSFLDKGGMFYLPPRDEELKELDRKMALAAKLAPIREMRDKVEGMCVAIKTRITLGQSILAFERQFIERRAPDLHVKTS